MRPLNLHNVPQFHTCYVVQRGDSLLWTKDTRAYTHLYTMADFLFLLMPHNTYVFISNWSKTFKGHLTIIRTLWLCPTGHTWTIYYFPTERQLVIRTCKTLWFGTLTWWADYFRFWKTDIKCRNSAGTQGSKFKFWTHKLPCGENIFHWIGY